MGDLIHPFNPVDWDAVRAIYREGIATRSATFETEAPSWEAWDAAHLPFARLVARRQDGVVGWAAPSVNPAAGSARRGAVAAGP